MKFKDSISSCGLFIAAIMYFFIVIDVIINPKNPDFVINRFILIPLILLIVVALFSGTFYWKKIKHNKVFIFIAFIILILLQTTTIRYLSVRYDVESWDMGVVFNAAQYYITNGSFDMSKFDYFLWFPNNAPLYNFYIILFRIFIALGITNIQLALNIFNAGLLFFSALFVERTVQLFAGKEYSGIAIILCIFLCPFSLYSVLAYTDTFSMIFLSAALYFYVRVIKDKANYYLNLSIFSVLVALGTSFKVSVLILAIAAIIDIILKSKNIKQTIISLFLVITISFGGFITLKSANEHSPFLPKYDYNYTIPYTHWVMMGLNGLGGYCDDDYQLITLKQPDKETRQQVNIEEIVNRVVEKGPIGMMYHIANKLGYIYSDGTFTACYSLDKAAVSGCELHNYVIYLGDKFYYLGYGSLGLLLSMLVLIAFGLIASVYKKDNTALMPAISLVGLTIFLLLWEAQPRYILNFLPIFILMTVLGIKQLFDIFQKRNH